MAIAIITEIAIAQRCRKWMKLRDSASPLNRCHNGLGSSNKKAVILGLVHRASWSAGRLSNAHATAAALIPEPIQKLARRINCASESSIVELKALAPEETE